MNEVSRRSMLLGLLAAGSLSRPLWADEVKPPPAAPSAPAPKDTHADLTVTEYLMHSTVRVECQLSNGLSVGTGFLFLLFRTKVASVPVIVTNRHVIKGAVRGSFSLTAATPEDTPDLARHIPVSLDDFESRWIGHPDPSVDLAILPCALLLNDLNKRGDRVFWSGLDATMIPESEAIKQLTPVEDVLVVGYPIGIRDATNNTPVFRRGITATAPYLDFNGKQEFLIDAAIFPGSSGSPVVLFESSWVDRRGTLNTGTRFQFLGVVYGVETYPQEGQIKIVPAPTQLRAVPEIGLPSGLGVCIRADRILEFEPLLVKEGLKLPEGYNMRINKL
jgi:hypothetical protein